MAISCHTGQHYYTVLFSLKYAVQWHLQLWEQSEQCRTWSDDPSCADAGTEILVYGGSIILLCESMTFDQVANQVLDQVLIRSSIN